jgi:hypothetical protein
LILFILLKYTKHTNNEKMNIKQYVIYDINNMYNLASRLFNPPEGPRSLMPSIQQSPSSSATHPAAATAPRPQTGC